MQNELRLFPSEKVVVISELKNEINISCKEGEKKNSFSKGIYVNVYFSAVVRSTSECHQKREFVHQDKNGKKKS